MLENVFVGKFQLIPLNEVQYCTLDEDNYEDGKLTVYVYIKDRKEPETIYGEDASKFVEMYENKLLNDAKLTMDLFHLAKEGASRGDRACQIILEKYNVHYDKASA